MFTKPAADAPYALHGERIADMGYSVMPCRPGSKRPGEYVAGNWYGKFSWSQYCDRAPSEYEMRTWTRWPDAGICAAMGFNDVIAIDVDTDDDTMRSALASVMPMSTLQKRGEKGFTAFYRGSRKIEPRHFDIHKQRIVDLLAYGTQTVIPPTVHPDTGRPYVWLTDDTLENTHIADLPELPDDIADQIAEVLAPFGYMPPTPLRPMGDGFSNGIWRELNTHALAKLDEWVPSLDLPKCTRNRRGGYVAVPFWRPSHRGRPLHDRSPNLKISTSGIRDFHDGEKGYTPVDLVMSAMGCGFDFAVDWLKARVGFTEPSLYGLEPWFPKPAPAIDDDLPVQPHQDITPAPTPPLIAAPRSKINPFSPAASGGLLGAIMQWVMDYGRSPVPEFAALCAISFVSAIYGRKFVGPTGPGLNLYLVGMAGPGFGKDHALKMLRVIAADTALEKLIGPGEVTSGSAIERVVRRTPCFVMPWDEIGVVLQSVTGRQASSWSQSIRKALLELYSLSTGVWTGKEHADPKRESATLIYYPTVSVLGMTTPTTFYKGLTEDSLSDGFLARLTIIHATNRPEVKDAPPIPVTPPSLIAAVARAKEDSIRTLRGNLAAFVTSDKKPELNSVPWVDEETHQWWRRIEKWQNDEIDESPEKEGTIKRVAEQTQKLATIRALSRDGSEAKVTMDDVEWGYAIVQRSIDCIDTGVREYLSGSEFEALTKSVTSALRRAKGGSLPRSVLLRQRGVSKHDKRMVDGALDRLVETGEVLRSGATIRLATAEAA